MEEDVYPYSRHSVMRAVAKLAQSVGFQGANSQPLNVLSDLTERYIQMVGRKAMEFAEHAGHNQADHIDVFAALADMGTQPHSLRNLIDFTEPMSSSDSPCIPKAKAKVLGLGDSVEVDSETPLHVYPWMPSVAAAKKKDAEMKRIREQEARKENEIKEDEEDELMMENPPSAPGGAIGADHYYAALEDTEDTVSSYPATPATPAVPQSRPVLPGKDTTPPKKKNVEQDAEKMLNSLFSPDKTDSTNSSPMQTPQKPKPAAATAEPKGKGNVPGTKVPTPAYKVPSPIHVGQRKVTPLQPTPTETGKHKDPLSMFDNSSSSDEEQLPSHNNSLKNNPDDDDPPGFSASDPESEPPGITDSSDSEDITHKPVKPAEPVPAIPTLPKPTSPKPVEAQTNPFDSEDERNVKKAKKEAKKEKKRKKKEQKAERRAERKAERKREKKREKGEKKKKKKKSRDRSSGSGSDSDADSDSGQLKLKINLQDVKKSNIGPDGQPKRPRGRPPKPKPKKEIKPRGRPPKDPEKKAAKILEAKAKQEEKERMSKLNLSSSSSLLSDPGSASKTPKEPKASKPLGGVGSAARDLFAKKEFTKMKSEPVVQSESSSDDDLSDMEPPVISIPKPSSMPKAPPSVRVTPKAPPVLPVLPPTKPPTQPPIPTVKIAPPKVDKKRARSPEPPEPPIKQTIKFKPPKQEPLISIGEPPKKKPNKDKKATKEKKVEPPIKKIIVPPPLPPTQPHKPPIKPPVAKVIEKQQIEKKKREKEEKKKKAEQKELPKTPVVKKAEQTVPKVKIKEPKKEEKKKEIKPEVVKPPTAPPVPTTTVTVTTENKPYLVTDDKGHQVVAYFDQNSVWICPTCGKEDDGSEMIGCDKCEDWYHNLCVGILKVPEGSWFCPKCAKKKKKTSKKK